MKHTYPTIEQLDLAGKVVFIRVDFNVPMKNGVITDDRRIREAIPTIRYVMEHKAKVVLGSHFGRPAGKPTDKVDFSLEPVAKRLGELMNLDVILIEDPTSDAPKGLLGGIKSNQLLLLENLRFDPGETKTQAALVDAIKQYADVYVNDAFGASHRAHASIVGLPSAIPEHGIGFLMQKEVEWLDRILYSHESPFLAIMGGSKVSDKIDVIESLVDKVDGLLIGGAMAYTFLKAKGLPVGKSRIEADKVNFAKELIKRFETRKKKLILPVDHILSSGLGADAEVSVSSGVKIAEEQMGCDIGPKTQELFANEIKAAKTIFWNGPMGIFEDPRFSAGTFAIAKFMSGSHAVTIVGGGDSAAAAEQSGFATSFSHISTGGGASLEYLEGKALPGLQAIRGKFFG